MATDEHYNEPGVMPEPLKDRKGTDMPATRNMFIVIVALAVFGLGALIALQFFA
jgi:hypothetical protein